MAVDVARSRIADPSLAPVGEQRIAWVARHSPVLNSLARARLADGALRGRRVAVVVHLEAKTAYLALLLAEAGAEVVAAGSNPGSTQDAVAAALVARGVEVHATHGASEEEFEGDLLAAADADPEIVVDDGAELTVRIVERRPKLAERLRGVTAVRRDALSHLKDRAILANAGHHDREIDVRALGHGEEVRPGITRHELDGGRRVYLLARGRLVNVAGADGHPVEIMDLSFSVQALAAHLLASASDLRPGVQRLPEELDREIARTKRATLGVTLPEPTEAQLAFLERWTP